MWTWRGCALEVWALESICTAYAASGVPSACSVIMGEGWKFTLLRIISLAWYSDVSEAARRDGLCWMCFGNMNGVSIFGRCLSYGV